MRFLKTFEEFLSSGAVRKITPDKERAKNLFLESEDKFNFFEKVKKSLGEKELVPNFIVETSYDILIELIRAKLFLMGYKTDSHEAEVAYMRNLKFSDADVNFMNELRYLRNGIKYYGRILNEEYVDKVLNFMYKVRVKLKKEVTIK